MEISVLYEFVALAETCNFQNTAENLALTQSTLSKHIRKLEEELGVPLFNRTTRNVTLNPFGILYLSYAKHICEINDQALIALESIKHEKKLRLNIGFMDKHGMYGIVEAISDFSRKHPEIKVNIMEQNGDALKELVVSGKADVIFYAEKLCEKNFCLTHFATDRLVAVIPTAHPLARATTLSLKDLCGEDLIEHRSFLEMKLLSEACHEAHLSLNYVTSIYLPSTIIRMIQEGVGISIMSQGCARQNSDSRIAIIPIEPAITFEINVVSNRSKSISQSANLFIGFIKENYGTDRLLKERMK